MGRTKTGRSEFGLHGDSPQGFNSLLLPAHSYPPCSEVDKHRDRTSWENGPWSGWSPRMGAGGGGEAPGLGATHWPRAFSSQLTSSAQPVDTPGISSSTRPVPFPREPVLDPDPGGRGPPSSPAPEWTLPALVGWGGLSSHIWVPYTPTPKGVEGRWGQLSCVLVSYILAPSGV